MNLSGMKVKTVNPGRVSPSRHNMAGGGFRFSVVVNGVTYYDNIVYESDSACKQAMREKVHMLRKQHAVG